MLAWAHLSVDLELVEVTHGSQGVDLQYHNLTTAGQHKSKGQYLGAADEICAQRGKEGPQLIGHRPVLAGGLVDS